MPALPQEHPSFDDGSSVVAQLLTASEGSTESRRAAHARIAEHYLSAWGGLDNGLPELMALDTPTEDQDYGIQHLAAHLEGAGQGSRLQQLLSLSWGEAQSQNAWYTVRARLGQTPGYILDVQRALAMVQAQSLQYSQAGEPIKTLGLEIRLVLMLTSLNSLATNPPVPLIECLVRCGVWEPIMGLTSTKQIPEEIDRSEALVALALTWRRSNCKRLLR